MYPRLEIDIEKLKHNAKLISRCVMKEILRYLLLLNLLCTKRNSRRNM